MDFHGAAKRLEDIDLPRVAHDIGVGEDEIHAILDTETAGSGFDAHGRPKILFEPHVFHRQLSGSKLKAAVKAGLAYPKWGEKPYPKDSYPRLLAAMKIDETAALKACSWGLGQILGTNHKAAGYPTVQAMVADFLEDEDNHLEAMIRFIKANRLDRFLRAHDWAGFARGYNGPSFAKNGYDRKLAASFAKWRKRKDTAWSPSAPAPKPVPAPQPAPEPLPAPAPAPEPTPAPTPPTAPVEAPEDDAVPEPLKPLWKSRELLAGIVTGITGLFSALAALDPKVQIAALVILAVAGLVIGNRLWARKKGVR